VLWGHAKQRMHLVFTLFLVSMALWGGTIFLMRSSPTLEDAFFWDKLAIINFALIAVFFLHFTFLFAETKVSRSALAAIYGLIPVIVVLAFSGLVAQEMQQKFYGYAPVPSNLFPVYLVLVYSCIFLGLKNLISVYQRPTSQAQRNRAGYLITATAFSLIGATTDFLPLLGLPIYPLGIVGNILFALLATVTITRHRMLDINVALRRGIGFLVVITIFAGLYVLVSLAIQKVLGTNVLSASVVIAIGLMVLGYLVFSPILRQVQDGIDRVFNWKRWSTLQELHQFTTETKNITDLNSLADSLIQLVKRAMDSEVVVLLQSNSSNDAPWTTTTAGAEVHIPLSFNGKSAWLQRLARDDRAYRAEEIYAMPEWQYAPSLAREQIESLDIKVFLPLRHKEELTGLLLLGAKTSGRGYTLAEIDLLGAVALHAAATMVNARLYEELRLQLQELKETQAQLVQSGKLASVGTLAAGVAHEVNNPIFAISGMTELLLSNPDRHLKSPQAEEYISVIAEMSARITKVVQGMLVYSRNDREVSFVGDYILHARLAWHRVTAKLQPCIKYIIPFHSFLCGYGLAFIQCSRPYASFNQSTSSHVYYFCQHLFLYSST
jgi:signal transduction histidine kinase